MNGTWDARDRAHLRALVWQNALAGLVGGVLGWLLAAVLGTGFVGWTVPGVVAIATVLGVSNALHRRLLRRCDCRGCVFLRRQAAPREPGRAELGGGL